MMPGEGGRLGHQLGNGARPVRPARDRGRAEGAVLVAAILDLEPAAGVRGESPQHGVHPRCPEPGGREHPRRVGPAHYRAHARQRRDRAAVPRRRAAHHHGFEAPPAPREPAHQTPQFRLALVGHRAGIHHRLVPGPNGSWPPRTPRRIGMRPEPNSAPADQLHVSNAPGPAFDQERHAADPANRTPGLGARSNPAPAIRGRSVSAIVESPTWARSRLSARAQPAMVSPGTTPMSTLPDTPNPSSRTSATCPTVWNVESSNRRTAVMRVEPARIWIPAPIARRRDNRLAAATRMSPTLPSLVISSL